MPKRWLARDKSLFFLQKLLKNSFFSAKLLIFKQNRCFSPKNKWTEWFSPFQGGPTALFVHSATSLRREMLAIAILWDVWTLKNQDFLRINDKMNQKSTCVGPNRSKMYLYNARTKCANLKRSFSLLKGAFFLRNGLRCDIIPGRVRGCLKTNLKSTSKMYFNSERTKCAGVGTPAHKKHF